MKRIRIFFIALVFATSVFLFEGKVAAQPLPIHEGQQVVEQSIDLVTKKSVKLAYTEQTVEQLEEQKETLEQELDSLKTEVQQLKEKLEEKQRKAEEEKRRLEELRSRFVVVDEYSSTSGGNWYVPGNCTWYVKNRRPDLPNTLGNANTWYARAQAQGWNVGSTPKKGAVATTTRGYWGHVAYVEGVSADGKTITISEMNTRGLYSMVTRTANASEFRYVYELN